jgi:hypothetical protein
MRLFDLSGYLLLSGLLAVLAALWVLGGRKWAGSRKNKGLARAAKDHRDQPTELAKANQVLLQTYSRRQTAVEATAIILVAAGVLCQFIDVWKEKKAMATTPPPVDVTTLIANSETALRQEWKRDIDAAASATNRRLDALDGQVQDLQRRVKALEDRFQGGKGSGKGGGGPDPDRPPQPGSGDGGARAAKAPTLQELADQVSGLELRVTTVDHTMHIPLRVGVPMETV